MSDCVGLWRRTLLIDTDGTRDTTTDVRWLQGLTAFVDLRRPVDPAAWDGFAGRLGQDGDVFEWDRFAGLVPQQHPDAGRMHWDGEVLVETGVHADYVEHWVLEPVSGPLWAMSLSGAAGAQGLMMRVGPYFGWATSAVGSVEISLGTITGAGWRITDSSEKAHDGMEFVPVLRGGELTVGGEPWTVVDSEGEGEP